MLSLVRTWAIVLKELKQLARDRITFGMIVMIPLGQLMLFGYAINTDVRNVPAGYVDFARNSHSRAIMQALQASQAVHFIAEYDSVSAAEAAITAGQVKAVLVLPRDIVRRIDRYTAVSHTADLQPQFSSIEQLGQWLVDGSDTMVAATIKSLRNMPLNDVIRIPRQSSVTTFEVVLYFNPEQRSAVNIVPGLLAIILTMTMILFTSIAIVREQEHGNMEFLITTPIRPIELMIGKILPFIGVGLIQTSIILSLGHWVFNVPIRGSVGVLLIVTILFILASLTLGLIISTIAKTQMQAMQMTVFILLPSILLSGFMFPYEAMPWPAQYLAEALPATHFMRTVRAVVLRDATLLDLIADLTWLAGFAVIMLSAAALRFRKSLD